MLNEHLRAMTEVVLLNRGTLDKFIGDCVMAFWGAPVGQPDHAVLAVRAAVAMRQAHQRLLARWQSEGLPEIHVGIGLNSGDVFVGNIGDERRTSYTVIGDHVNLASRLEGVARGGEVLITASTFDRVRERVEVRRMEPVRVKGKRDPVELYDVVRLR
jgi:adenylate cyclase